MTNISRRASMVAALLARFRQPTAAAVAASAANPDAELIDLGRQLLEAIAEEERLVAPYYRLVRFTYPPDVAARLDALAERQEALRQQIAALPAATLTGLRVKARVMMLWLAPDGEVPVDAEDADAVLAWSLCQDLLDTTLA